MYASNVGNVRDRFCVQRRGQRRAAEHLRVGERRAPRRPATGARTEAGQRPLIGVATTRAEVMRLFSRRRPRAPGTSREQVVEAPVGPAREQLVGDAVARFGRRPAPPPAGASRSSRPRSLMRAAPGRRRGRGRSRATADRRSRAARATDAASPAAGSWRARSSSDAELRLQRDEPPPALARVVAERRRQTPGEEPLDPRTVGAPLARAAEVADPAPAPRARRRLRSDPDRGSGGAGRARRPRRRPTDCRPASGARPGLPPMLQSS